MLVIDIWAHLAAHGPVCGLDTQHKTRVLHAVTDRAVLDRIGDSRTTIDAPCGAKVRIVPVAKDTPVAWPPRVAALPEGWSRCAVCHEATGKRRPAACWTPLVSERVSQEGKD